MLIDTPTPAEKKLGRMHVGSEKAMQDKMDGMQWQLCQVAKMAAATFGASCF